MFTQSIFLVGMTASGKSAIGKDVATELGYPFFDSDHVIEERTGATVSWIFEQEGEKQFRRREAKVIGELSQMRHIVLATGGGAILHQETRRRLSTRGFIVHLRAPLDALLSRLVKDRTRPLLQNDDPAMVLCQMAEDRLPLYNNLADITFDTDLYKNSSDVAENIVAWYRGATKP